MTGLTFAILVGMLFATGTFLILRREPIKLLLGMTLLTYGVNALLFSSSTLRRGVPPIVEDKEAFAGDISQYADPLPQALILTAIVISFGVTAFMVVLVNRRNTLVGEHRPDAPPDPSVVNDPFAATGHFLSGLDQEPDDYEWLEDRYGVDRPDIE